MNRNSKVIEIQLKSDLCSGSGFSYAGVIDTDVSFDGNGVVCISGRRIKGCLRNTAKKYLGYSDGDLDAIFGVSDDDDVKGVVIGNAIPKHFFKEATDWDGIVNNFSDYVGSSDVLDNYCSVKAQTKLDENGVADATTLRFTRVVNQYDPVTQEEMVFIAKVEIPEEWSEEKKKLFEDAVSCTRNLGMMRNRGLGSVIMRIGSYELPEKEIDCDDNANGDNVRIDYLIRNTEPLMLGGTKINITQNYISGSVIQGAVISAFKNLATERTIEDTFFNGKVKFMNAYPAVFINTAEGTRWKRAYPVPEYINRLKKTKKYVNVAAFDMDEKNQDTSSEYCYNNGNQPKKITGGYLYYDDEKYIFTEPVTEIVYHHSSSSKSLKREEGELYFQEVLSKGQYFAGSIICDAETKNVILECLRTATIKLGKSRTAQYGECELEGISVRNAVSPVCQAAKRGEIVLVTLLSDGLFRDESGICLRDHDSVRKKIADDLGFSDKKEDHSSQFVMKTISGYNAILGHRREDISAVAAGSAFEYELKEDLDENELPLLIGSGNSEGFGEYRIINLSKASYVIDSDNILSEGKRNMCADFEQISRYGKDLLASILLRRIYNKLLDKRFEIVGLKNVHASTVGRLTLMLKEVLNENPRNIEVACAALKSRIDSIKTRSTKSSANAFLNDSLNALLPENVEKCCTEYCVLKDILGDKTAEEKVFGLWPAFVQEVLTQSKYSHRG